jgi:hypothetical protein
MVTYKQIKLRLFFPVLLYAVFFSACASVPGPLYSWGNYEDKVYAYLRGESPVAQIGVLQNDLLKIEERGKKAPPGYYAHLGMLYAEVGDHGQAVSCFVVEKTRFPESAVFMDYLLAQLSPRAGEPADPEESIDSYAVFSEGSPRSILVMPPVNRSPDIMASTAFLATSTWPLAESGYYVIPVSLSNRMFRENGIIVAEDAHAIAPSRLREIFGADSALYITITRYGVKYVGISSLVEAAAAAMLIDLRSGLELWSGKVALAESSNNGRGNLLDMLISAAFDQIANVLSDRAYDVGKKANHQMLSAGQKKGILYGPYHSKYGTDLLLR